MGVQNNNEREPACVIAHRVSINCVIKKYSSFDRCESIIIRRVL